MRRLRSSALYVDAVGQQKRIWGAAYSRRRNLLSFGLGNIGGIMHSGNRRIKDAHTTRRWPRFEWLWREHWRRYWLRYPERGRQGF